MKDKIDILLLTFAREMADNNFKTVENMVASIDTAAKLIDYKMTKEEVEAVNEVYDIIIKMQEYETHN